MKVKIVLLKLVSLISLFEKTEGKVKVTFNLPSLSQQSKDKDEDDSSSSFSSSDTDCDTSSSSSEGLLFKHSDFDGKLRFSHLKKDDDLLTISKKKKKTKNKNKKNCKNQNQSEKKMRRIFTRTESIGGKQSIGFIYNQEWQKKMIITTWEKDNGYRKEMEKLTNGIIWEPLNVGWWLFSFDGGKSCVSGTIFKFQTSLPVKVSVVDLFCRGDSFAVMDGDKLIAQTSRIRADPDCEERIVSPWEAMNDGRWSSVIFELEAGEHFIQLKSVDNPMKEGGIGAIKFDHILPLRRRVSRNSVCRGYNGFVVLTQLGPSTSSESLCLQLKMDTAKIEAGADEAMAIKQTIKSCVGKNGKVWAVRDGFVKGFGVSVDEKIVEVEDESIPTLCRVRLS